jgi:acyl-CoA hydrolase
MVKDWREDYNAKLCSASEAAQRIKSGDSIFNAGCTAIPFDFTEALAGRKDQLQGIDYYACLSTYPLRIVDGQFQGHINYHTIFTGAYERLKAPEANINQLSVHLAETDRYVKERVRPNALAVNVSPPDAHGWMTFGPLGGMALHTAKELADTVIATVQPSQPRVPGEFNDIRVSEVDAIIDTDVPISTPPSAPPTESEKQIASQVVPLVEDGSTIQIGIGSVPGAVASQLAGKKHLGVRTEMVRIHQHLPDGVDHRPGGGRSHQLGADLRNGRPAGPTRISIPGTPRSTAFARWKPPRRATRCWMP